MSTRTTDNPLGLSKAEAAKLQSHADTLERVDHQEELRKRGLTPTAADVLAELDPAGEAARRLAGKGVEAVRVLRPCRIDGLPYSEGDIIFPFPARPIEGFIDPAALDRLPPEAVLREGESVTIRQPVMVRGKRYAAGEILSLWPDRAPRGFLAAGQILELLRSGAAEPAALVD